jgi:RNA polymerase sigma factor (TIGR02999 family)
VPPGHNTVTRLLQQSRVGDKSAFDQLMPFVYQQLRKLAANCLRSERPDHTLPATALVHEAYLRLVDSNVAWEDRVHFYAVAARAMRHILVDHAKARHREKRGGGGAKVSLESVVLVAAEPSRDLVGLDEAMSRLEAKDERKSRIIELLFFGGLTYDEVAAALQISPATVHRELRLAKAWLHREVAHAPNARTAVREHGRDLVATG